MTEGCSMHRNVYAPPPLPAVNTNAHWLLATATSLVHNWNAYGTIDKKTQIDTYVCVCACIRNAITTPTCIIVISAGNSDRIHIHTYALSINVILYACKQHLQHLSAAQHFTQAWHERKMYIYICMCVCLLVSE